MVGTSLFLILLSVVYVSSSTTLNIPLLKTYDSKTCKNEASCELVDHPDLTDDRRTLRRRPCMCDADCVFYRDCCADSKYYDESEQNRARPFHCQSTYKVYFKITCPETWTDEDVKSKCNLSTSALGDDASLIIPVTNTIRNITYGNKYCALCNGETEYTSWLLSPLCGEAPAGLLQQSALPDSTTSSVSESLPSTSIPPSSSTVKPEVTTNFHRVHAELNGYSISGPTSRVKFRRHRSLDLDPHTETQAALVNPSSENNRRKRAAKIRVNFSKYYTRAAEIWKTAKYDPYSGFFVTKYADKDMICTATSKLQADLKPYTRHCVPNIIEVCKEDTDADLEKQCHSHTSHIYNKKNNRAYRNKYCAACDGAETTYLTGCPITPRDEGGASLAIYL